MAVEHHQLTLEYAIYSGTDGEVTAAFCSCGQGLLDDGPQDVVDVTAAFVAHVTKARTKRLEEATSGN